MKRFVVLAALLVAACQNDGREKPVELVDLLTQRDGAACAHSDVAGSIYSMARGDYSGGAVLATSLNHVVLSGIDEGTGRINCRATWEARSGDQTDKLIIDYAVQLDVTGKQFVVEVQNVSALRDLFQTMIATDQASGSPTDAPPSASDDQAQYKSDREYTPEQQAEFDKQRAELDEIVNEGRRLCAKGRNGTLTADDLLRVRGTARELSSPQTDEDAKVYDCLVELGQNDPR